MATEVGGGPGEQIFDSRDVVVGNNLLTYDVSNFSQSGTTYARFRLSTAGDLGIGGTAANGEVEDYQVTILPPASAGGVFGGQNTISTTAGGARSVFAADVDGDGDVDVLSASAEIGKIVWYENDGSENFMPHIISTTAIGARSVFAADVDEDGDTDVLSASYWDGKIAWYENDGSENFSPRTINTAVDGAGVVFAADVDGDGDTDVLSASFIGDKIAWHENRLVPENAVWNGDAAVGATGNAVSWADINNWTVDGVHDQQPATGPPGDDVVFASASTIGSIELGSDRIVNSIRFQADYALTGHALVVTSGAIEIDPGVTATISANLTSGNPAGITKLGNGKLLVTGQAPVGKTLDVVVAAGTLEVTSAASLDNLTINGGIAIVAGAIEGNVLNNGGILKIAQPDAAKNAVWNGDAAVGANGNAVSWADVNNWTVDGLHDQQPATGPPGDDVMFASAPTIGSIDLGSDRIVNSIRFQANYALTGHVLTVTSGAIEIDPGVTATIAADLTSGMPTGITKLGDGSLVVTGQAPVGKTLDVVVAAGTLEVTSDASLNGLTINGGTAIVAGTIEGNVLNNGGILKIARPSSLTPSTTLSVEDIDAVYAQLPGSMPDVPTGFDSVGHGLIHDEDLHNLIRYLVPRNFGDANRDVDAVMSGTDSSFQPIATHESQQQNLAGDRVVAAPWVATVEQRSRGRLTAPLRKIMGRMPIGDAEWSVKVKELDSLREPIESLESATAAKQRVSLKSAWFAG